MRSFSIHDHHQGNLPYGRSLMTSLRHSSLSSALPDLPIGYIGLSLGPQDPRGPQPNCGTHRVNGRHMTI